MINRDWNDFKSLHSNIAGAREAFENACESLFRSIYTSNSVSQVSVRKGDGGIDIFIGELGIEPIIVIQCKFFLEKFSESQHSQIQKSFITAATSKAYELKQWILCIPRVIDIDEHSWWFKWKAKQLIAYSKPGKFIDIKNGNELLDLFKKQNLYNSVFKITDSIRIEEIHKVLIDKKEVQSNEKALPKNILFTNYTIKNEPYYLQRDIDKEFIRSIEYNNIWVSGNSGFGKTTLITRYLLKSDKSYCYCDLSPISINSSNDVLQEILVQLEEKFVIEHSPQEKNVIKNISEILSKVCHRDIVIIIDELSVKDISILRDIGDDLIQLVNYFTNNFSPSCINFIISTILNPQDIVFEKSKAIQHFYYIKCSDWSQDISKLFDLLDFSLELNLEDFKDQIISACNFSPRILKSIFRKIVLLEIIDSKKVESIIQRTLSEL